MMRFWFAPESPRPLALMRILLGATLFVDCAIRWPHVVELYSTAGVPMPLHPGTVLHPPALPAAESVLLYAALLFALACATLGWWTRLSLIVAAALLTWVGLLDYAGTLKKYTVVGIHLLVLLSFTRCGAAWSLDRLCDSLWRSRKRRTDCQSVRPPVGQTSLSARTSPAPANRQAGKPAPHRGTDCRSASYPLTPAWPRRLMQILVCLVYLGAAATKFRTPDFATGDLLFFSLLDLRWGGEWLGMWLVAHPKLLVLSSYATLLFETAFPLLVWVPRLRRPMLVAAVLFHLSLGYIMTLFVFTPVMLAALCAFLDESDFRLLRLPAMRGGRGWSAAKPRTLARSLAWHALSFVAFLAAGAAAVALGLAHQRSADWYGVFRGEPAAALSEIDEDRFAEMIEGGGPRNADYIYRVELGERISTHHAFGGNRLRPGQTAYLLVRFLQPHPAMRIEIEFIDPDGDESNIAVRLVEPRHVFLPIEFRMTESHLPGTYQVIVKANGFVAAKKSFELLALDE
ncbi:MAG: HTTM domain-containing protein [Planctomycetales bacterium]